MSPPIGLRLDLGSAGAELRQAERLFRQAIAQRPDFVEARLRLGRVLGLGGRHQEAASELRGAISGTDDPLMLYYANLFLGAEQTALDHIGAARAAYERAAALAPLAQSPQLGLSQLAHRSNDRAGRRAIERVLTLPDADAERTDPWWTYHMAQGRTADERLAALRRLFPVNTP